MGGSYFERGNPPSGKRWGRRRGRSRGRACNLSPGARVGKEVESFGQGKRKEKEKKNHLLQPAMAATTVHEHRGAGGGRDATFWEEINMLRREMWLGLKLHCKLGVLANSQTEAYSDITKKRGMLFKKTEIA